MVTVQKFGFLTDKFKVVVICASGNYFTPFLIYFLQMCVFTIIILLLFCLVRNSVWYLKEII